MLKKYNKKMISIIVSRKFYTAVTIKLYIWNKDLTNVEIYCVYNYIFHTNICNKINHWIYI